MKKRSSLARFEVPKIALPLILSNLTVPLLGLSNSIVVGHLDSAYFLAAVGFGVSIFDFIYWCFSFLRQATTGFIAQAFGRNDRQECVIVFERAMLLAFLSGLILLLLMKPVGNLIHFFLKDRSVLTYYTLQYFYVRIWDAPAVLMNYVFLGWFLGVKRTRYCLYQMLIVNGTAIVLNVVLVFVFHMAVRGVALADVIGQWCGVFFGMYIFLKRENIRQHLTKAIFEWYQFKRLLALNRDIFIRTVSLMSVYLFFNYQSALFGQNVLAANTVLINIMMLLAYAQEGFNNAAEILVANSIGRKSRADFWAAMRATCWWSGVVGIASVCIYLIFGRMFVLMITSIPAVIALAYQFLPWVIFLPVITVWCFWLDGVFMGATWGREMRNSMLVSVAFALLVWYATRDWGVQGLWCAFVSCFIVRTLTLALFFKSKIRGRF